MKFVPDIAFTFALGALAWGCHLAWHPAGFIAPSVVILYVVLRGYRVERQESQDD